MEQEYAVLHVLELESGAFLEQSDSLALPAEVAEHLGLQPGEFVTINLDGQSVELKLTGLLPKEENTSPLSASKSQAGYLSLDTAQALAGSPGQISHLDIILVDRANINELRVDILGLAGNEF